MKRLIVAAVLVAFFVPAPALADELPAGPPPPPPVGEAPPPPGPDTPLPTLEQTLTPNVLECLRRYPTTVSLFNETDGVQDVVCMPLELPMPWWDIEPGDVYMWCGSCDVYMDPSTPPTPRNLPIGEVSGEELAPPTDLEAFAVSSRTAKLTWELPPMPTFPAPVQGRVVPVVKYIAKCEGQKERTSRTRIKIRAKRGDRCKVRAINANGVSAWSQKVRVKAHRR